MTCESPSGCQAARVFVDQAAEDGFAVDLFAVEVGNGEVATVVFAVGDALGNALVRPGHVVVRLVFRQDGAQVALADDQHAVEELSAQGADKALADRIHARRLDSGAQDPGAGGLEDGVERGGEVRSAVADQELNVREPLAEAEGEVAGLLHGPLARRARGDPADVHPAGAMLDEHQDIQSPEEHGVHVQVATQSSIRAVQGRVGRVASTLRKELPTPRLTAPFTPDSQIVSETLLMAKP